MSRRAYWQAATLLVVAEIAFGVLLAKIAGLSAMDFAFGARKASYVALVVVAFFFWPSLALMVQRLHDRDLPGWWGALLHVLLLLFYIRVAFTNVLVRSIAPSFSVYWPEFALLLLAAWLLIEVTLLRGTRGPNRFGPDPESPGATPSAVPVQLR